MPEIDRSFQSLTNSNNHKHITRKIIKCNLKKKKKYAARSHEKPSIFSFADLLRLTI